MHCTLHLATGILAIVAGAQAQTTALPPDVQTSLAAVLLTALPASDLSSAIADPSGWASAIASSVAAGKTPSWYQALPSDVKSLLPLDYPATTSDSTVPLSTGKTVTGDGAAASTSPPARASSAPLNSTVISTVSSPTLHKTSASDTDTGILIEPTATPTASPAPSSLSTGAKIGIGVGIPAIALIASATVVAFILGKRRGNRTAPAEASGASITPGKNQGPYFGPPNQQSWAEYNPHQQQAQPYFEYPEMATRYNVPEMPGSPVNHSGGMYPQARM